MPLLVLEEASSAIIREIARRELGDTPLYIMPQSRLPENLDGRLATIKQAISDARNAT